MRLSAATRRRRRCSGSGSRRTHLTDDASPWPIRRELLALAERAARAAGDLLRERVTIEATGLAYKSSSTDPVSDADRDAEAAILGLLRGERPDDAVLGEEGTATTRLERAALDHRSARRHGQLPLRASRRSRSRSRARTTTGPLVGVVHQPLTGETFTAIRGAGRLARRRRARGATGPSRWRGRSWRPGFSYEPAATRRCRARSSRALLPHVRDVRRAGSAALDLAWVACGPPRRLLRARAERVGLGRRRAARQRGRRRRAPAARRRAGCPARLVAGAPDLVDALVAPDDWADRMSTQRRIALIGVPLDLGQGRRGVDMGPSAIRYAGLAERLRAIGYTVDDRGDIAVPRAEATTPGDPRAKYLEAIVGVAGEVAVTPSRRRAQPAIWSSCSAATTRSRSACSRASRACTARAPRSGSTRMPTATRPTRA